jgi:hypothetical protein
MKIIITSLLAMLLLGAPGALGKAHKVGTLEGYETTVGLFVESVPDDAGSTDEAHRLGGFAANSNADTHTDLDYYSRDIPMGKPL